MSANITRAGFTPGPWFAHRSTMYRGDMEPCYAYDVSTSVPFWDAHDYDVGDRALGVWSYPDGYARIARSSDDCSTVNALANALLIASAPAFYAALETTLQGLRDLRDDLPLKDTAANHQRILAIGDAARSALALARGEGVT